MFWAKTHADLFWSVSCVIKWKIIFLYTTTKYHYWQFWLLYTGLLCNDHLPIMTTETLSPKWSLYTGLTVFPINLFILWTVLPLNTFMPDGNKRLYLLTQSSSWNIQVCLSLYGVLLTFSLTSCLHHTTCTITYIITIYY